MKYCSSPAQILLAESGDGGDGENEGDDNRDVGGYDEDGDIGGDSQLSKVL